MQCQRESVWVGHGLKRRNMQKQKRLSEHLNRMFREYKIRTRKQTHIHYLAPITYPIPFVWHLTYMQVIRQLFCYVIYMDKTRMTLKISFGQLVIISIVS